MKSAAEYPEYQGDPDNIQFLTRDEHLEAHKGSWQNPTNWYYNPETKEFVDFGENKPIPCATIRLSEPVCSPVIERQNKRDELKETGKDETAPTERTKPTRQEHIGVISQAGLRLPKVAKALKSSLFTGIGAHCRESTLYQR